MHQEEDVQKKHRLFTKGTQIAKHDFSTSLVIKEIHINPKI